MPTDYGRIHCNVRDFEPSPGLLTARRLETNVTGPVIEVVSEDRKRREPSRAVVIRRGPPKMTDSGKPIQAEVIEGDIVWIGKYVGHDMQFNDEKVVILAEEDVLFVEDDPVLFPEPKAA